MNGFKMLFHLRRRLVVLAVLGLLPAFAIIVLDQVNTRSQRIAETEAYTLRMTDVVFGEVIRGMTGAATLMIAMRHSSQVQQAAECENYLAGIRTDVPSLADLAVVDADGAVVCHSGVSPLEAVQGAATELVSAAAPGLQIGTYTPTPAGPALPMAMAVPAPTGDGVSYIYLNVILTELERLVGSAMTGVTGATIVADREGTVLLRYPEGSLGPGESLPLTLATLAASSSPGNARVMGPDGSMLIVGYRPVTAAPPIAVFFGTGEAEVLASLDKVAVTNTVVAFLGTTLAVFLAWLVGRLWVQRPVDRLRLAVAARRAGTKDVRTGFVEDGTEFGSIGSSIDHLFDELDDRERAQALAEEQRDLNAREVQHRVKNLLAVIQVIAKQTFSKNAELPEIKAFEGRINAIVRANTSLLAQEGQAGDLAEVAKKALEPFTDGNPGRVLLTGPDLSVLPKFGFALAMVLYEMATNSAKYGSLSVPDGQVSLDWSTDRGRFKLVWRELGGPSVRPPQHSGFGTMMIKRVLAAETSGSVHLDFDAAGVICTLDCPLDRVQSAVLG